MEKLIVLEYVLPLSMVLASAVGLSFLKGYLLRLSVKLGKNSRS